MKRVGVFAFVALFGCRVADQPLIVVDCAQTYEDGAQLRKLPPGATSHWLQPWRAYQDTWPAARFLSALGTGVDPRGLADDVARNRLAKDLVAAGFSRVTFEMSWNQMDGATPTRLDAPAVAALLPILRANGLRPSVLLNSNQGGPMPAVTFDAVLTARASKGADRVQVDEATFAKIVPHRSGLDSTTQSFAAEILFVAKDAATKTVTLSKKLPLDLDAGPHAARTLAYRPFFRPRDANDAPQPAFEDTMRGWLAYVGAVAEVVKRGLGSDAFDLQVWNISGPNSPSAILDVNNYYDTPVDTAPGDPYVVTAREILARTAAWLGRAGGGFEGVHVVDGFASRDFGVTAANEPAFVAAVGRDVVVRPRRFPRDNPRGPVAPVDAQLRPDGSRNADGLWDGYAPTYGAAFPELFLSALAPESLTPDLAPFETGATMGKRGRGRQVPGLGGEALGTWITAYSMTALTAAEPAPAWDKKETTRLRAVATLRAVLAHIGTGVEAMFLYRFAEAGGLDQATDDGAAARALARTADALRAPQPLVVERSVDVQSVAICDGHAQFAGDGSAAHPPLYDRAVVAVFPFQVTDTRFVAAAYVMTRDLGVAQPARRYVVRLHGVRGDRARVSVIDPMTAAFSDVEILSSSGAAIEIALPLDASPRLIVIDDG